MFRNIRELSKYHNLWGCSTGTESMMVDSMKKNNGPHSNSRILFQRGARHSWQSFSQEYWMIRWLVRGTITQQPSLGTLILTWPGFYRSSYKAEDGSTKYLATTQMEPTDARRVCLQSFHNLFVQLICDRPSHASMSRPLRLPLKYLSLQTKISHVCPIWMSKMRKSYHPERSRSTSTKVHQCLHMYVLCMLYPILKSLH